MKHFTTEQMQRARKTDLYAYLMRNHPDSFRKDGESIHPRDNSSLSIKRGYSGYMDFATEDKGNSIDFLTKYMNYELDQAVFALCGEPASVSSEPISTAPTIDNIPPIFPKPLQGRFKNLFAYLLKRGISQKTIQMLIDQKILYQDELNNMVFINKEKDWGEKRGTNTYADKRCKHRNECDNYSAQDHQWCSLMNNCDRYAKAPFHGAIKNCRRDGFWWFQTNKHPTMVYVCEAAIDAISLYELHQQKGYKDSVVYVSIGGASKQPAIDRLKKHIKTILAVDNDDAGAICRNRNPELESIIPIHKDWNEDLIQSLQS